MENSTPTERLERGVIAAIVVAALGYFVDIYDLILFGVVRVESLKGIGVAEADITRNGEFLLNIQMIGMLIGGIIWGVLGDKKGRLSVLFGSIAMYSLANLANGFVNDLNSYAVLRFIAGIGLAGELGAGVTLVSELMPARTRGYGTSLIAAFGLLGAVAAALVGKYDWNIGFANWRIAYVVGGGLGILLLALRIGVHESGVYANMQHSSVVKGDFLQLFRHKSTLSKYLKCILIGVPIWYVVGILVVQAPEFAKALNLSFKAEPAWAILLTYAGLSMGDLFSGVLSQLLKSRRQAVLIFLMMMTAFSFYYLTLDDVSPEHFYGVCFLLGFSSGYWAVFVTIAAEQFGTNIRATATTTVPNFVRGSLALSTGLFQFFRDGVFKGTEGGILISAALVGGLVFSAAFLALHLMRESFGQELDFYE